MGLGWLWGQRCRKEGLFPWTACLPRMGGGQGERRTPGQMLWGGVELWSWFPTPLSGQSEKSLHL